MVDWIKEHKNIFIGIVAGVVVIAMAIAVTAFLMKKGKNADKPVNPVGNSVNNETVSGNDSEENPSVSDESVSQIESSDPTNIIPSTSEKEPSSQTVSQTDVVTSNVAVPTGVETLTDGNKKVYYPVELTVVQKKYPVVVWANGTGCATDTYDKLLNKIAEGGYIVVADSSVMTADGTAQIDSIDYIIGKNGDSNSVFYGKVDSSKIGATGHSQGGRSSVNAAQKDSRIKCIVSIAGASSKEEANGLKAPALFLTGTADMVVVSSQWCKPSYDASEGRAVYASLKGGVHTTCMTNPEKVSGYVVSWFDAYLKNNSAAKAKFQNGGALSKDSAWQDFASKN
ncbi:MAG: dienelactone hydrolase family protein [Oscillospiraceae bacterium]|nr:dienelactone hydrolase family protein [Oscillospiraceae bacterium]